MSDPPKSLFGDGGKIIVPMPKGKASVASKPAITGVNTEKRFTLSQPDDKDVKDAAAATNTAKLEGKLASIGLLIILTTSELVGQIVQNLGSRGYTLHSNTISNHNNCSIFCFFCFSLVSFFLSLAFGSEVGKFNSIIVLQVSAQRGCWRDRQ